MDASRVTALHLLRVFAASKTTLTLSIATGLIAGVTSARLLTFITNALESGRHEAIEIAAIFFALCFVALASSSVSLILLSRIAQENLYGLRLWLSRCIVAAPLRQAQALGAHRLMAALTKDVESVVVAQEVLPALFIEGSKIIAVFVYLWMLSPPLLFVTATYVIIGVVGLQAPQKWAMRWLEQARKTENAMFDHFRAATEGGKELKMDARRRRAFLEDELRETAGALKAQRIKALAIFVLIDRWAETLFYLLLGLVLFVIPRFQAVSSETLTGFTLAILFLGGPLSLVGGGLPNIGKGVVALRNLEAMGLRLTAEAEAVADAPPAFRQARPGVLELEGVTHRYSSENDDVGHRLGPITLRIEPGELIFVTGGNGSGKTTLALLILGLFPPDAGAVRLGGTLVTHDNREAYRQNFSAVFADAFIFDSLLGYADAKAQERARELLALLELENKLRIEDGRFSTVDLSRGQRKRLALLTAYIEDRPFYLFDEWAAEQDPKFRELFYHKLLPELKALGKTIIVITHDDRYFHSADRVLHMASGEIEAFCRSDEAFRADHEERLQHA
ncbi:cyclic peptide export ABC transporter [Methylosinus sp. LW4]|uniref:cyclic peptide export ABC transporter n=1 Tax=Methylosinus sp. LW4 TaxID=136993 RepID=UPI000475DDB6|nr:cyclic peptide export ABC transporter [Methylosinus sp. LW4]